MAEETIIFEAIKIFLAIGAVAYTYFKFFREGEHKQRIEFDIDCQELGIVGNERIVEIGCNAENKGNVEQRFEDIRVTVRGIEEHEPLNKIKDHEPRLSFPSDLSKASLISKKWKYFFVRPHVKQRFPLVICIPSSITHILVRSTFQYKGTDDIHSAERAFYLNANVRAEQVAPADAKKPRR